MNTLCRSESPIRPSCPVTALEYRDVRGELLCAGEAMDPNTSTPDHGKKPPRLNLTEDELAARLSEAANSAAKETEAKLRAEYEVRMESERGRIAEVITNFQTERAEYYTRVEPELVNLILAVAERILHREAQVDRMLLAALAKVAVENLQQRSHVVVRVPPDACVDWREYFASHLSGTKVEVLEDSQLEPNGCVLETELGTADLSLDAQLKEIERGFFDLLAKRPEPR